MVPWVTYCLTIKVQNCLNRCQKHIVIIFSNKIIDESDEDFRHVKIKLNLAI